MKNSFHTVANSLRMVVCVGIALMLALSVRAQYLYVTQGNSIYDYSPSGEQSTFATGVGVPGGLAFNNTGDLFESDIASGNIYAFTPNGAQRIFATGLSFPLGLAFDSAGNLFEADGNSGNIYQFTPSGVRSTFATGVSGPGLAFDSVGNLYATAIVGSSGKIYKYTPGGVRSTFATGLNNPVGLAIDSIGNVFEADNSGYNINEFTPGGVESTFASTLPDPVYLAFGPAPVPEPPASGLLAVSAAVVSILRRRKNMQSNQSFTRSTPSKVILTGLIKL